MSAYDEAGSPNKEDAGIFSVEEEEESKEAASEIVQHGGVENENEIEEIIWSEEEEEAGGHIIAPILKSNTSYAEDEMTEQEKLLKAARLAKVPKSLEDMNRRKKPVPRNGDSLYISLCIELDRHGFSLVSGILRDYVWTGLNDAKESGTTKQKAIIHEHMERFGEEVLKSKIITPLSWDQELSNLIPFVVSFVLAVDVHIYDAQLNFLEDVSIVGGNEIIIRLVFDGTDHYDATAEKTGYTPAPAPDPELFRPSRKKPQRFKKGTRVVCLDDRTPFWVKGTVVDDDPPPQVTKQGQSRHNGRHVYQVREICYKVILDREIYNSMTCPIDTDTLIQELTNEEHPLLGVDVEEKKREAKQLSYRLVPGATVLINGFPKGDEMENFNGEVGIIIGTKGRKEFSVSCGAAPDPITVMKDNLNFIGDINDDFGGDAGSDKDVVEITKPIAEEKVEEDSEEAAAAAAREEESALQKKSEAGAPIWFSVMPPVVRGAIKKLIGDHTNTNEIIVNKIMSEIGSSKNDTIQLLRWWFDEDVEPEPEIVDENGDKKKKVAKIKPIKTTLEDAKSAEQKRVEYISKIAMSLKACNPPRKKKHIEKDGDCLFRAIAYSMDLLNDQGEAMTPGEFRLKVWAGLMHLRENGNPEQISIIGAQVDKYGLKKYEDVVCTPGKWAHDLGDTVPWVISNLLNIDVHIYDQFHNFVECLSCINGRDKSVSLIYNGSHYDATMPRSGGTPTVARRFPIGSRVICKIGGIYQWEKGTVEDITNHNYCYEIELDIGKQYIPPQDNDMYICAMENENHPYLSPEAPMHYPSGATLEGRWNFGTFGSGEITAVYIALDDPKKFEARDQMLKIGNQYIKMGPKHYSGNENHKLEYEIIGDNAIHIVYRSEGFLGKISEDGESIIFEDVIPRLTLGERWHRESGKVKRYFVEEDVAKLMHYVSEVCETENTQVPYTEEEYLHICGLFVKIRQINEGENFAHVFIQKEDRDIWVPIRSLHQYQEPIDDDDEELDEENSQKREPVPASVIEEGAGDGISEAVRLPHLSDIFGTCPGHFRITSASSAKMQNESLENGHVVFIEDFKEGKSKHMGFIGAPLHEWITLVDENQVYVERMSNFRIDMRPGTYRLIKTMYKGCSDTSSEQKLYSEGDELNFTKFKVYRQSSYAYCDDGYWLKLAQDSTSFETVDVEEKERFTHRL